MTALPEHTASLCQKVFRSDVNAGRKKKVYLSFILQSMFIFVVLLLFFLQNGGPAG